MASNSHKFSWLGSGILLATEVSVADDMILRPITVESDPERLRNRAGSQFEYGLLCSIAPTITFELVSSGATPEEAAIKSWNNQYALMFLSIVLRTYVHHSIQASGGYNTGEDVLAVSFAHGMPLLKCEPKPVGADELQEWKNLLPNFIELLQVERFRFAASIAGTLYVQPNPVVQVASIFSAIEALLDVEQELRFRISMLVARLLANDPIPRQELFQRMKRLYDGRSKCVHGGGLAGEKVFQCRDASLDLLRRLIMHFVQQNKLPDRPQFESLLLS